MGDKQRENYLIKFREGDFEFVTTINSSYNGWEYWIQNANWFFYRELYENYIAVFSSDYQVYWEKIKFQIKCLLILKLKQLK